MARLGHLRTVSLDAARAELIRSRAFIRGAETQLTKALAALDAATEPSEPPVEPEPPPPEPVEPPVGPDPPPVNPPGPLPEGAAFIIGPQVPLGDSPWPFFDRNMAEKAPALGAAAVGVDGSDLTAALNANYYDLALSLYALHARSGDGAHLSLARSVARWWWEDVLPLAVAGDKWNRAAAISPRNSSLGGLIAYALDGHGLDAVQIEGVEYTLWDWLTHYVRHHWGIWLGTRLGNSNLHYGVRDGGMLLTHVAQLARVHPDESVRAEMQGMALRAARDYYARLQREDGGWYWRDDAWGDDLHRAQPLMVGLLMEGLIAAHQVTHDETVARAIIRGTDWLWTYGYDRAPVTNMDGVLWRSMRHAVNADGSPRSVRTSGERYGQHDGAIRDERQKNPLTVHAFGYAYKLTGDAKYVEQGDEIFAATFGKGEGPGADAYWGLADFRAKEYAASYRSAGRYLAWRK